MKIECSTLILDLDGTLSDNSLGITRCFNHALHIHGLAPVPDAIITQEIGPPLDATFLKLAPGIGRADVGPLVASYRERYSDIGFSENTVYAGIPAVLAKLHSAGVKLGVCTSKRGDFAEKILSLFGLAKYFGFVDGGEIGINKSSQLASLLKSGAIDDHAVMVGDRAVDITSARENGLRSIGVLWGFGDYCELSGASPSAILEEVSELGEVVA